MSLGRTLCNYRLGRLLKNINVKERLFPNPNKACLILVRGTAVLCSHQNVRYGIGLAGRSGQKALSPRFALSYSTKYDGNILQEWSRDVPSFGSVTIRLAIPVRVVPISLQDAPSMDKTRVRIIGQEGADTTNWDKSVKVDVDIGGEGIMVSSSATSSLVGLPQLMCIIEVPVKYGVAANLRGTAGVQVQGLEGEEISLQTEDGSILTRDLKCGTLKLITRGGDIVCEGATLGNIDIRAGGSGKVSCDRVQGQEIVLANETGPIDIKALYAERSSFSSLGDPVVVGSCHGTSTITIKEGQLDIGALDGSLKATLGKGDINVQITRLDVFSIKTESGDVNIKVPPDMTASLRLKGRYIQFDDKLGAIGVEQRQGEWKLYQGALGEGKDSHLVEATARGGRIKVMVQDWATSAQATSA